jgi:phosphonate transport system substrate-binding protein
MEIHFAYSKAMFVDVNENDAKAAIKVYALNIGDQNGIYVKSLPELPDGTNAIARLVELEKADVLILTAEEFFALEKQGLEGPVLLAKVQECFTENYLLLSRTDSAIGKVEDLQSRSLIIASDARNSLATAWLEVLCREHGLGPAAGVLARIARNSKTTQVVLPVFFRKADACITTRASWEVMCELNPQLKKQLRVVAVSPPLVPTVTCFRQGFTEAFKQRVIKAVDLSSVKPEFKQLMALFKTDGLVTQPISVLAGTRAFLANYHQLCAGTNDTKTVALIGGRPLLENEKKGK